VRAVLDGLSVLWVGVHCDPRVAAGRHAHRPDRIPGMATTQAAAVHGGVSYDLEVDTTGCSALSCAHRIAQRAAR
jgi:chloramphenicol 3-O phosphotransferase